jgi:branched-chain amino acid transport system ATP-binding protein
VNAVAGLLRTQDLTVRFGGVIANHNIAIGVDAGQVVGLIGPNGAGKTTFVELDGADIRPLPAHERVRRGLVRTFQSLELFEDLSVEDNLLVAAQPARRFDALLDMIWPNRVSAGVREQVDRCLALVGLTDVRDHSPSSLSQGQRKLVGVARALAARPRLLLLDEPAAGLDTVESQVFGRQLRGLPASGASVLLIDHDMGLVLSVCDYLYVLDFGAVIAQGTPAEIRQNPAVIQAYLGESAGTAQEAARALLAEEAGE